MTNWITLDDVDSFAELCGVCNKPFVGDEWDDRHDIDWYDGEFEGFCHSYCCQAEECRDDDATIEQTEREN